MIPLSTAQFSSKCLRSWEIPWINKCKKDVIPGKYFWTLGITFVLKVLLVENTMGATNVVNKYIGKLQPGLHK